MFHLLVDETLFGPELDTVSILALPSRFGLSLYRAVSVSTCVRTVVPLPSLKCKKEYRWRKRTTPL